MFCEPYRQPLTEAAVADEVLPRELEAHLGVCKECSSAFAAEQALFASIDRASRDVANADVPASLLARVRQAIPEGELPAQRIPWRAIFVPTVAALLVATTFLVTPRFTSQDHGNVSRPVATSADAALPTSGETVVPTVPTNVSRRVGFAAGRRQVRRLGFSAVGPEVRVQPTTEFAIAQLIRLAHEQPAIAESFSRTSEPAFVVIKPIEVAAMAWAPLSKDLDVKN
jgi:anti-sigma factor RsiW